MGRSISRISGLIDVLSANARLAESCRHLFPLVLLLAVGCSSGDRPELGEVRGRVRLDGKPLSGAGVMFVQSGFRPSTGKTDENGYYELTYLRDIKGAAVGKHTVRIDLIPSEEGMPAPRLPVRYNRESELTREVTPGSNTINFKLQSD